jgi:methanogenic corrinoid protein MtbC1
LRMYVDLVREHDMDSLRRQLTQAQVRLGLGRFVTEVIAPLNTRVGDAWMRGQMEIFEEHMYTEAVQVVLRSAIGSVPDAARSGRPRVLLTTFPGEPHGLGLLMAEAIFELEGARCLSLGVQTPIWDIVLAAGAHRADIVALGFTGCMNPNQVVEGLGELRSKLPRQMEIWAGGTAPVLHRRTVEGVVPIASLAAVQPEVQRWREAAV